MDIINYLLSQLSKLNIKIKRGDLMIVINSININNVNSEVDFSELIIKVIDIINIFLIILSNFGTI